MSVRLKRFASPLLAAGVILIVCGIFWMLVRGQLALAGEIALAAGLLAVAAYVALEPARVQAALSGRTARQGGNAVVVSLAVLGILVLLNVLAARHHKRIDLTAERQFSLSPQSLQVLAGLQEPVAVTAFMTPGYFARQEVEDLLKEYTYRSDRLQVEYVDPDLKPALARQFGISLDGTIIFQARDRRQEILGYDEQQFTSALVKVTRDESKTVYFLTGHQERSPEDGDQAGYQRAAEALERGNYEVETLNLAAASAVPADAAVLIVAAPTVALSEQEIDSINAYVEGGGSLLVLGDPTSDVSLDELLAPWGVSLRPDIVIDPMSAFLGDIATPLVDRFPYHTISKDLGGLSTVFPLARSIARLEPAPEGVEISSLVQTSPQSWGETDRSSQQVHLDPGEDTPGPLDLAVAATRQGPGERARLVLFGDADLVSNGLLSSIGGNLGNIDLFLNAVSWLAEEEALISIRPNPPTPRLIFLTPPQVRLVMYTSIIFMPGLVVLAGVWVWWRRRQGSER